LQLEVAIASESKAATSLYWHHRECVQENFTRNIWERGLKSQDIFSSWSLLKFSMFDATNVVPRGTSPAVPLNVGIDVEGSITGAVLGLVLSGKLTTIY
jgi:hypothetical protein